MWCSMLSLSTLNFAAHCSSLVAGRDVLQLLDDQIGDVVFFEPFENDVARLGMWLERRVEDFSSINSCSFSDEVELRAERGVPCAPARSSLHPGRAAPRSADAPARASEGRGASTTPGRLLATAVAAPAMTPRATVGDPRTLPGCRRRATLASRLTRRGLPRRGLPRSAVFRAPSSCVRPAPSFSKLPVWSPYAWSLPSF